MFKVLNQFPLVISFIPADKYLVPKFCISFTVTVTICCPILFQVLLRFFIILVVNNPVRKEVLLKIRHNTFLCNFRECPLVLSL